MWRRRCTGSPLAAEKKNQFAEYALGVLYLKRGGCPQGYGQGYGISETGRRSGKSIRTVPALAKFISPSEDMPKDVEAALRHLNAAAEQGNQYAQYTLGKLYLDG